MSLSPSASGFGVKEKSVSYSKVIKEFTLVFVFITYILYFLILSISDLFGIYAALEYKEFIQFYLFQYVYSVVPIILNKFLHKNKSYLDCNSKSEKLNTKHSRRQHRTICHNLGKDFLNRM